MGNSLYQLEYCLSLCYLEICHSKDGLKMKCSTRLYLVLYLSLAHSFRAILSIQHLQQCFNLYIMHSKYAILHWLSFSSSLDHLYINHQRIDKKPYIMTRQEKINHIYTFKIVMNIQFIITLLYFDSHQGHWQLVDLHRLSDNEMITSHRYVASSYMAKKTCMLK